MMTILPQMQLWNRGNLGLCQIIVFVACIALLPIWNRGLCQGAVFAASIALIHIGAVVNWNQRSCQVIVFVVPIDKIRIDVNSSGWYWLIKISILECPKGL